MLWGNLEALRGAVDAQAALSLPDAVAEYVEAISGQHGERLEVLLARTGLNGQDPITNREMARRLGVRAAQPADRPDGSCVTGTGVDHPMGCGCRSWWWLRGMGGRRGTRRGGWRRRGGSSASRQGCDPGPLQLCGRGATPYDRAMARTKKQSPLEAFNTNMADAEALVSISRHLTNHRTWSDAEGTQDPDRRSHEGPAA